MRMIFRVEIMLGRDFLAHISRCHLASLSRYVCHYVFTSTPSPRPPRSFLPEFHEKLDWTKIENISTNYRPSNGKTKKRKRNVVGRVQQWARRDNSNGESIKYSNFYEIIPKCLRGAIWRGWYSKVWASATFEKTCALELGGGAVERNCGIMKSMNVKKCQKNYVETNTNIFNGFDSLNFMDCTFFLILFSPT